MHNKPAILGSTFLTVRKKTVHGTEREREQKTGKCFATCNSSPSQEYLSTHQWQRWGKDNKTDKITAHQPENCSHQRRNHYDKHCLRRVPFRKRQVRVCNTPNRNTTPFRASLERLKEELPLFRAEGGKVRHQQGRKRKGKNFFSFTVFTSHDHSCRH